MWINPSDPAVNNHLSNVRQNFGLLAGNTPSNNHWWNPMRQKCIWTRWCVRGFSRKPASSGIHDIHDGQLSTTHQVHHKLCNNSTLHLNYIVLILLGLFHWSSSYDVFSSDYLMTWRKWVSQLISLTSLCIIMWLYCPGLTNTSLTGQVGSAHGCCLTNSTVYSTVLKVLWGKVCKHLIHL